MNDIKQELTILKEIAKQIEEKGGTIYYVGGYVRDKFTKKENKDIDVEVYGITSVELMDILSLYGMVDEIGASFGVYMIHGLSIDFALPRREVQGKIMEEENVMIIPQVYDDYLIKEIQKKYPSYSVVINKEEEYGHKDFIVIPDPFMSLKEATIRRDFTMNALMENVLTHEVIDLWNGIEAIEEGVIRHIDDETFIEDPLRVLRACQFASRFEMDIAVETQALCKKVSLDSLPKERIFVELEKALMKSRKPSIALEWMKELGVIAQLLPELEALFDCMQDPVHHPEGTVWNHTKMVVDVASTLKEYVSNPLIFMFGSLTHDIGKPSTTEEVNGRITSYGHDREGVAIAESLMKRITTDKKLIEGVKNLTHYHMRLFSLYPNGTDKAIRKLSLKTNIYDLRYFAEADYRGRGVTEKDFTLIAEWFERRIKEVGADKEIKALVSGKDLIALGLKPGKEFGILLEDALNHQLEGLTKEEILKKILL